MSNDFLAVCMIKSTVATYMKIPALMESPRLANYKSVTHF